MSAGRPSLYTEAIGTEICARLAAGESLNSICLAEHMPAESTVRAWALAADHPISANYARARELGYLKMAEELLDIADDGVNDFVEKKRENGDTYVVADHEHISRSKLRVDTRKWILGKMLPKVFGDKVFNEHTGKDGAPIQFEHRMRNAIRRAKGSADPGKPADPAETQ